MTRLFKKIGASQEGTVERGRSANDDVVAPAGARVLAVDHEFVSAEPRLARFLVDCLGRRHAFTPAFGRMDIDLDDRVWRDPYHVRRGSTGGA